MTMTLTKFHGGSWRTTLTTDQSIPGDRLLNWFTGSAGQDITLPPIATFDLGGPHFVIMNDGGGSDWTIKDADGVTVDTINPDQAGFIFVTQGDITGGGKQWYLFERSLHTAKDYFREFT